MIILRCTAAAILLSGLYFLIAPFDTTMHGQPPKANAPVLRESVGATNCIGCHAGKDSPAYEEYQKEGRTEFIRLDEYHTWNKTDLHRMAFKNITPNENGSPNLARKMQDSLRQNKTRGPGYRVDRAMECLACHAVDRSLNPQTGMALPIDKMMIDDEKTPRFVTHFGVSCEACHGLAGDWLGDHFKKTWRDLKPEDKSKKGQIDLRSPQVRAERCASCHVGNRDEGKFVTHEMYAAGHPPLPVFEMATYGREQPAHYYSTNANVAYKKMFDEEMNKKANGPSVRERFHYRPDESGEARDVAVGAIVAFRSSVKLLEHDAGKLKEGELLDFAHFDCAACHHDLKSPSDRQNRRGGIPGRPLMKLPTDLLETVLDHSGNTEFNHAFGKELNALRDAFDARPFGDPDLIKKSASSLKRMSAKAISDSENITFRNDPKTGLQGAITARLLRLNEAKEGYLDLDSAQQLTWALLALQSKPIDKSQALAATIRLSPRDQKNPKELLESVAVRLKDRMEKEKKYDSREFLNAIVAWLKSD